MWPSCMLKLASPTKGCQAAMDLNHLPSWNNGSHLFSEKLRMRETRRPCHKNGYCGNNLQFTGEQKPRVLCEASSLIRSSYVNFKHSPLYLVSSRTEHSVSSELEGRLDLVTKRNILASYMNWTKIGQPVACLVTDCESWTAVGYNVVTYV